MVHALLPLVVLLGAYGVKAQQQAGEWTMNASTPLSSPSTSGCVILGQLTSTTNPPTVQALFPICPSGTPTASTPSTGATVHWPLSANAGDGQGVKSDLIIYGQVTHKADRTDVRMAQAGCVMRLGTDQAQYLLKRSLTWNNGLQQLWDNTGNGFILTPQGDATLACGKDDTLLPSSLWLPDPYIVPASDAIWQIPFQLTVPKPVVVEGSSSSSAPVVVGIETGVSSSSAPLSTSTSLSVSTSTSASASISSVSSSTSSGPAVSPAVSPEPVVGVVISSSAPVSSSSAPVSSSAAPLASPYVTGAGLIGIQSSVSSSVSASTSASVSSTSAGPIAAVVTTTCEKETVTEVWTTTVTASPTAVRRRGAYYMFT